MSQLMNIASELGTLESSIPSVPSLSSTSSPSPANSSIASSIGSTLQSAGKALGGALVPSFGLGLSIDRVIAIVLGLILIAGGIFLFRPVRDTVVQVGKTAGKAALAA
jgi:hypothetical protein